MTFLLVAPLRLSLKDKRKKSIPLHESASKTSSFGDELERASFCMLSLRQLRAIAASLQVMRGKTVRSAVLKGGISRALHSGSSNSRQSPPHSPLVLQPVCRALHPGGDALGHLKTSHFPVKAYSETS